MSKNKWKPSDPVWPPLGDERPLENNQTEKSKDESRKPEVPRKIKDFEDLDD